MVRILKVKHLEERRRLLLERSESHRQLLKSDVAGLQASAAEIRSAANSIRASWRWWAAAAAIAGLLVGRRRKHDVDKPGLLSRLFAGIRMAGELMAIARKIQTTAPATPEHDGRPESVDA